MMLQRFPARMLVGHCWQAISGGQAIVLLMTVAPDLSSVSAASISAATNFLALNESCWTPILVKSCLAPQRRFPPREPARASVQEAVQQRGRTGKVR
jgi:hypothetical protein